MKISEADLIICGGLIEQKVVCDPSEPHTFILGEIRWYRFIMQINFTPFVPRIIL